MAIEKVPEKYNEIVEQKKTELIESVANVDDELGELFIAEEEIGAEALRAAIRRSTIARTFIPVFMGSAYKNKGYIIFHF